MVERIIRWILGGVFCLSSIAKGAAIGPFILTVQRITNAPVDVAPFLSWLLVIVEAALGLLLFTGRWRRWSVPAAAVLLAGFALLLLSFLVRGEALFCGCFGPFGPKLPLRAQILLDVMLALSGFAARWRGDIRQVSGLPGRRALLIYGTAALVIAFVAIAAALPEPRAPSERGRFSLVAERAGGQDAASGTPSVFFLVDFADFGCVLCLDDFIATADSIEKLERQGRVRAHLIGRQRPDQNGETQERMLKAWMQGNGYGFEARVDTDSLFERAGCTRSTIVVLDRGRNVLLSGTIPLGPGRRDELIRELGRVGQ